MRYADYYSDNTGNIIEFFADNSEAETRLQELTKMADEIADFYFDGIIYKMDFNDLPELVQELNKTGKNQGGKLIGFAGREDEQIQF